MINRLYAGDTLAFGVDVPDYLPADGWTLKMRFTPRFTGQDPIVITASPDAELDGVAYDYVFTVEPTVTVDWKAGAYGWASWVEKAGARQVLQGTQHQGELTVLPDPATIAAGTDTRSPARKALDDAMAAQRSYLASRATVASYTIGDRSMTFHKPTDFVTLISQLQIEVARERRREALAAGEPDPRKIYVRACR